MLLHGGGANAHWWDHIAPSFADRYRVIALDFRGHGSSDYPEEHPVGAFDVDLECLLEYLELPEVLLVGHSMGARIAISQAARFNSTRALVLIDPARGSSRREQRRGRLALALQRTYASREEAVERFRFLPSAQHVEAELHSAIATQSVRRLDNGRYSYCFDPRWFGVAASPRPAMDQVQCPTLILRGSESQILTRVGAEELCGELPRAELKEMSGAGHHLQIEQPDAAIRAIAEFIDRVR